MLNWDEIFSAQNWAREQAAVYELVASVLESFEYLSSIEGIKVRKTLVQIGKTHPKSENFRYAKPILL